MLSHLLKLNHYGIPSLFVLVIMVSVGPFGDTEYAPSLPAIARDLHVSYEMTQLTMTSYLAGYAIFQLLYGPLSDRFGRKPIVLIGAAVLVLGSVLCFVSTTITQLIIGRFIQAIGASAGSVICYAAVRDAYPEQQRKQVFAKINAIFALAPALGPIVGALIDDFFGWRMNFLLLVLLSIIMFTTLWLGFPETKQERVPINVRLFFGYYRKLFSDPYYWVYATMLGLSIGIVYCSLIGSPTLVIDVLQLPSRWFAVIALGVMLGFMLGSIACRSLTQRCNDQQLLLIGLLIILVTATIFALLAFLGFEGASLWPLLLPIAIVFTGVAFVLPVAAANALAPFEHISGYASAMMGFMQMAIASLATAILGLFSAASFLTLPVMFIALSLLGLLCWLLIVLRPNRLRMVV